LNHPANIFARAFIEAQKLTAIRVRFGPNWAFFEFWKDKIKPYRHVVDKYIDPILADAITKKRAAQERGATKVDLYAEREVKDDETLLDHLVNYTNGQFVACCVVAF
jgi:hypothetical protein